MLLSGGDRRFDALLTPTRCPSRALDPIYQQIIRRRLSTQTGHGTQVLLQSEVESRNRVAADYAEPLQNRAR